VKEKEFSSTALGELKSILSSLHAVQRDPEAKSEILRFRVMVDDYLERKQLCHPEVLKEIGTVVARLSGVSHDDAKRVCDFILGQCRECLLHLDDCFMNLTFLAFKSVESGKLVEANRVRPPMRIIID